MFPSRRHVTALAAVAATSLVAAGCSSSDDGGSDGGSTDTIVVSTFPFGVEEFTEAVVDPFTAETGIEVELDTGSNADRLSRLQLEGEDTGIDVMLMSDAYVAIAEQDGLLQPVTQEDVPALAEIAGFAVDDAYSGPAYSYQLNGMLYNTDELSEEQAADWELYADPAFAGQVALPDIAVTAGQLTVSGVADTYGSGPYDVDTAFETMAGWAPNVLQFYSSTTEFTNLLTQGEIVGGVALNGFATNLIASGEPIGWVPPAEGRYMATNRAVVPAGAPNAEGAFAFIDYLLSVEAQQSSAEIVGDLPVNLEVEIPAELTAVVGDIAQDPTAAGYATLAPAETVDNRNEWVDRFAREVVGG
ncbi:ABC transporter substrate-binding protein [Ruania alkalisoli]|uniref:ABC transporter substrate-binding protein n=1 Tax=Ruania alkalisoli TaxID=2779775 RepID=A0A7M1STP8_9MICO|nr:ABC transporter substrate-binding protein [Ruania alkalisoli]QOR70946.1 ABC transporter substrate-binding protein [Ruania alkalisoli]